MRHPREAPPAGERPAAAPADPHPPRTRTRTILYILIGVLGVFVILLVTGTIPRLLSNRALDGAAEQARNTPPQVFVIHAQPAAEAGLTIAATTQAIADAIIYARVSGYLSKRYVDIGERVKAGQLLAEIQSPELDQQLSQAQANLQQARKQLDLQQANLVLARATMDRYKGADQDGAVAKLTVDQAVAGYGTAQASVAAAQATIQSNEANVRQYEALTAFERVLAPFDGTITQRNVDVGALITAGSPTNNTSAAPTSVSGAATGLFEVSQLDTLRVFVNVPQAFAPNVKVGLPAQVKVRGQLTHPSSAKVARTANALDPGTRTLLTEVDIPNASHALVPGMFVYVDFQIPPAGTRWRVPATALIFDTQGTRVVIVAPDNKLHFQPVVVGRDFGDTIDIQAGLNGSETLVKQPTVSLQEGEVVTPRESQNAAS